MLLRLTLSGTSARTLAILGALLASRPACSDPADYVFVPYTEAGTARVAYAAGLEHERDGQHATAQSAALGWTPSRWWSTSIYAGWHADPGQTQSFDAWSWINQVALIEPGSGPMDAGALCEVERPRDRSEGTALTCGLTLQGDTTALQWNVNPLLKRVMGAEEAVPTQLNYQWQVKSLWRPQLEIGMQGFGELGPWRKWLPVAQQQHVLGPALFLRWPQAAQHRLLFDAAVLFGVGPGSPAATLRVRIQQEF